jgi:outer membrane protein TolC
MRKNINKLIAFAIGISVINGSGISAFAADNTQGNISDTINTSATTAVASSNISNTSEIANSNVTNTQNQINKKQVLTLDDAIDAALSNSGKLTLKSKEIRLYENKLDVQDELDKAKGNDNGFPYDKLELTVDQTKEQKSYMEDNIAQDITNKYNDLIARGRELNKLINQIEIQNKENEYLTLKRDLGLATEVEVKNAEITLQKLKNTEQAKETQLKNAQDYFKVLTDKDLNNYVLSEAQEFEAFRINGSQDEYFDEVIEKYYKYDNKLIDLTKDDLDDNEVDKPSSNDKPNKSDSKFQKDKKDALGNVIGQEFDSTAYATAEQAYEKSWSDYGTYLQNKYNLSNSKVTLEENKKNLKKGLKESYASLLDMGNTITVAKTNIQVKNNELSIAKLKYDEGLMTKTAYDKLVLDNGTLETDLRASINDYNTLKNKIQKPWLLN